MTEYVDTVIIVSSLCLCVCVCAVERLEEKHETLNRQNKELRDANIDVCMYAH